jgi:hypothetical protein
MAVNFSTDTDDDGSGTTGTIRNAAWKAAMATQIDALVGDWTTWTPTIGGSTSQSGQAYTTQIGRRKVTAKGIEFYGQIQLSTLGTITGSVQIKSLDTANTATSNRYASVTIGYFGNMTASFSSMTGTIAPSSTAITLRGIKTAATSMADLAQADLSGTTLLMFSGFYEYD